MARTAIGWITGNAEISESRIVSFLFADKPKVGQNNHCALG
jgi:hypothetical protein